jgi:pyruvate-ferredoxin/flavodoxin oxidoreductase
MGANPQQALLAFREAEAYDGPSLILAYSPCIAHGFEMSHALSQQWLAVHCGYWPLVRYNPGARVSGANPFVLDSSQPNVPFRDYAYGELRYRSLESTDPGEASRLLGLAEAAVTQRWNVYAEMSTRGR